jgi:Fe2+ transport system protein FeoA
MKTLSLGTNCWFRLFYERLTAPIMRFIRPKPTSSPMDHQNQHRNKHSDNEQTLDQLKKGEAAVVKRLITSDNKNLQKLLAMGILPGRIVRVVQKYPAFILQIEHTQAAMDRNLAEKIIIEQ